MTIAATSSSAAGYIPPASVVAAPADAAAVASSNAPTGSNTAATASSAPTLSSDTVAALVAQQATGPADPAPQYTLPASVVANMQAFATTAPTQYTDQINAYAATLADGSTASDSDKLQAWITLTQLLTTGSICKAGNIADLQKAVTAANGSYQNHVAGVELEYNQIESKLAAPKEAAGQYVNGYQNQLTALNSFSASDQQILLATMSAAGDQGFTSVYGWQAYDTVDDWKSALQQQAASFDAQDAAQTSAQSAAMKSGKGSGGSATAGASDAVSNNPYAKLLASAEASTTSASDIALQLITDAANRTAKSSHAHQDGTSTATTSRDAQRSGSSVPQGGGVNTSA